MNLEEQILEARIRSAREDRKEEEASGCSSPHVAATEFIRLLEGTLLSLPDPGGATSEEVTSAEKEEEAQLLLKEAEDTLVDFLNLVERKSHFRCVLCSPSQTSGLQPTQNSTTINLQSQDPEQP